MRVLVAAITVLLAACGGGGSSDTTQPVSTPPASTAPTPQVTPPQDPIAQPTPTPTPGECIDTPPVGDGFGWNGVTTCSLAVAPPPAPEPEPEPEPEPTTSDPVHIVKINFDGIEAFVLDFSFSQFGRLQANALFVNNTGRPLDAQCRIELISGFEEVAFSFISIDDLAGGDTVPDQTTFLTDGLNGDSFDRVRLSGCFTTTPRPVVQATPEPDFEYVIRTGFEGIEAFVLGYTFDQFGNFQVNGLFRNNSNNSVDAQCRLTLINGLKIVDDSFLSVDDIATGETVPDNTRFLVDGINQNSFDRVRLSGCFTL